MKRSFGITLVLTFWIYLHQASGQAIEFVNAFPNLSFHRPVFLTHSGDGTNRIFVVEETGRIKVFANDSTTTAATVFLDLSDRVSNNCEQGLLGLAFKPSFSLDGQFYVNYTTAREGPLRTVVSSFAVLPHDPNRADPASESIILEIPKSGDCHNAGMLFFGADGYLYINTGDDQTDDNGQSRTTLLGKVLRIDVNRKTANTNYAIPADNPFRGNPSGFREEIWAWGFRNPWRSSQDPVTGQIWLADVGLDDREEINLVERGKNYGWSIMEGSICKPPARICDTTGLTLPIKDYPHVGAVCAVTGGYVYRGFRQPDLLGAYIYGDFCSGEIWMLRYANGTVVADSLISATPFGISSFGVDQRGELYVCNYWSGTIHRFAGSPDTGVDNGDVTGPATFKLEQNYPNPFNPGTKIRYTLHGRAHVTLRVLDMLGREVRVLVNRVQDPGEKVIDFDGHGLSSGVYFYRLSTGRATQTRRMVLLR